MNSIYARLFPHCFIMVTSFNCTILNVINTKYAVTVIRLTTTYLIFISLTSNKYLINNKCLETQAEKLTFSIRNT